MQFSPFVSRLQSSFSVSPSRLSSSSRLNRLLCVICSPGVEPSVKVCPVHVEQRPVLVFVNDHHLPPIFFLLPPQRQNLPRHMLCHHFDRSMRNAETGQRKERAPYLQLSPLSAQETSSHPLLQVQAMRPACCLLTVSGMSMGYMSRSLRRGGILTRIELRGAAGDEEGCKPPLTQIRQAEEYARGGHTSADGNVIPLSPRPMVSSPSSCCRGTASNGGVSGKVAAVRRREGHIFHCVMCSRASHNARNTLCSVCASNQNLENTEDSTRFLPPRLSHHCRGRYSSRACSGYNSFLTHSCPCSNYSRCCPRRLVDVGYLHYQSHTAVQRRKWSVRVVERDLHHTRRNIKYY